MLACVFPGQGSQHIGMGASFYQSFDAARHSLEWASDTLSLPLKGWFENSTEAELQSTDRTQLMLFLASHMMVSVAEKEYGKRLPHTNLAGHSLGEYTALWAAGVWSADDVLQLVYKRGLAMKQAAEASSGQGMMAVLGLDTDVLSVQLQGSSCVFANDNCPGQVVISGPTAELEDLQLKLKEVGAKRCVMLPVSGAFHSPFMASAAEAMKPHLMATGENKPICQVWMNVSASLLDEPVAPLMVRQITEGVKWRTTVENMAKAGVTTFIEIGAGQVLTQLNKRNAPNAQHLTLNDAAQLDSILTCLGEF